VAEQSTAHQAVHVRTYPITSMPVLQYGG
jgi:hypothetical protein